MNASEIYRIALGENTQPDSWQSRFATDPWPEMLIAPTGSGKTAGVSLGWAAHRLHNPETTPRRLVWCLPMRTLVEQTASVVREWFVRLHGQGVGIGLLPGPGDIHVLMGGAESARWIERPAQPTVIVGTQDMLLSRALMRGYAASRTVWPMEFALLHVDTQWVFDEVQLMGSGRATSAQLEAFRRDDARMHTEADPAHSRPARSLWISATLEPHWLKTVDFLPPAERSADLRRVDPLQKPGDRLWRLANAKKTLTPAAFAPNSSTVADIKDYVAELARAVLCAHRPGHMSLVILNRVQRAQNVHTALGKALKGLEDRGTSPELVLVHGRFRPADRRREFEKIAGKNGAVGVDDVIVVATQAVEAGVDLSAAVLWTELAPWPSMVQRFGRANRYAKLDEGADVRWLDLLAKAEDTKSAESLALPYSAGELQAARKQLRTLTDAAPARLPAAGDIDPPLRVIRRKDLDDLFDTDPDLTGFDVDISPYVRDTDDADVRVYWRNLATIGDRPPHPHAEELCSVPIAAARDWVKKLRKRQQSVFVRDPQWRPADGTAGTAPPGWTRLTQDPWPGLVLLADTEAGGYSEATGFTGDLKNIPGLIDAERLTQSGKMPDTPDEEPGGESETYDADPRSEIGAPVLLTAHLRHVEEEATKLCDKLQLDADTRAAVVRAARWHDLGKAHDVFQETMRRGLPDGNTVDGALAKTVKSNQRHGRAYFRHELASALALLSHEDWSRDTDLTAYLVAAHHGKVRMNLRALPRERAPTDSDRVGARFARGVWEGDALDAVDLGGGERWEGGRITLALMELGWDETTRESWTERTRDLLRHFGPFRLAWMETLVRVADWRASAKERKGVYGDA